MDSLAITDHGVMYGVIEFYEAAREAGIKPIIGCEVYVAEGSHTRRNAGDKNQYHLVLLAKDQVGYHNLMQLTTRAHLEGFYYKPRVDRELLSRLPDDVEFVAPDDPGAEELVAMMDAAEIDAEIGAAGGGPVQRGDPHVFESGSGFAAPSEKKIMNMAVKLSHMGVLAAGSPSERKHLAMGLSAPSSEAVRTMTQYLLSKGSVAESDMATAKKLDKARSHKERMAVIKRRGFHGYHQRMFGALMSHMA